MVQLDTRTLDAVLEQWRDVTQEALRAGAAEGHLRSMLKKEAAAQQHQYQMCPPETSAPNTVYTELPPGLIDLPAAVKKYNLKPRTVQDWVRQGHVRLLGRLRAPSRGGGYLVVSEEELRSYIMAPRNKGGRPPKHNV